MTRWTTVLLMPLGFAVSLATVLGGLYLLTQSGNPPVGAWIYASLVVQGILFGLWVRFIVLRRQMSRLELISYPLACATVTFVMMLTLAFMNYAA